MRTTVHAFPDTNVLIHFPALDGLDWRAFCGSENVVVHVAQSVLTELNKLKEIGHSKWVRKRAASVQRRLKQLLNTPPGSCQLAPQVNLAFEAETPDINAHPGLHAAIADDMLIASVLQFRTSNTESVVIVTEDSGLGLIVKAGKWQIGTLEPAATARFPEEPDADEKEKDELRRQLAIIRSALPAPVLQFSNGETLFRVPGIKNRHRSSCPKGCRK
jgi:predicted ribonuclease YlaK